MSDDSIDFSKALERRYEAQAQKMQFAYGDGDMSEYQLAGGCMIDALLDGVNIKDIIDAFMKCYTHKGLEVPFYVARQRASDERKQMAAHQN